MCLYKSEENPVDFLAATLQLPYVVMIYDIHHYYSIYNNLYTTVHIYYTYFIHVYCSFVFELHFEIDLQFTIKYEFDFMSKF